MVPQPTVTPSLVSFSAFNDLIVPVFVMFTRLSTSTPSPSPVTPLPVIVPWLTMVTSSLLLMPSMLMPDPLSPWIVPPRLFVMLILKTPPLVSPPVMPWRAPSIVPVPVPVSPLNALALTMVMPELVCASTPSLLLPVVVVDLIRPSL